MDRPDTGSGRGFERGIVRYRVRKEELRFQQRDDGSIQEMKENNVVLIGFMGSGKTSVGLRLSYRLRRPVEDTDKLIERREGCSISHIFAAKGEAYFRDLETALLRELADREYSYIYSAGGGTPVRECNRELLKRIGTVIYLRVRPETVYERLKGDRNRPLLQCENPRERIRELLESRREAYESAADVILDADNMTLEDIVETIAGKAEAIRGEAGLAEGGRDYR